jgi:hypothetical protein
MKHQLAALALGAALAFTGNAALAGTFNTGLVTRDGRDAGRASAMQHGSGNFVSVSRTSLAGPATVSSPTTAATTPEVPASGRRAGFPLPHISRENKVLAQQFRSSGLIFQASAADRPQPRQERHR